MKNIFSTSMLAGLILLMAKNDVSAQTGYTINGRIADLDQPTMAYLYKFTEKGRELIDSTAVNDGTFVFKGVLQHPVSAAVQIRKVRRSLNLFLENENFQLLMQNDWKKPMRRKPLPWLHKCGRLPGVTKSCQRKIALKKMRN
jgi:hypothetical protein